MRRRTALALVLACSILWGMILAIMQMVTGVRTWMFNLASFLILIMIYDETE